MILEWLDSLALTIGPGWACCVAVIAIPVCLFAGVGLWCLGFNLLAEWQCRRKMRREGRLLGIDEVKRKIVAEQGTLILEYPSLGWNNSRVWWTSDDVAEIAPMPPRSIEDFEPDSDWEDFDGGPFTEWVVAEYLSEETGKAFLISVWNSKSAAEKLFSEFPSLKKMRVDSQLVDIIQPEDSKI